MDSDMQRNHSALLNDSRSIISELKTTVLNIHKAKLLKQRKDLPPLIVRKDNLILLLRHKSRELSIFIENLKLATNSLRDTADQSSQRYQALLYAEECLRFDIRRCQDFQTKELDVLGIDTSGDRETVLQRLEEEFTARQELMSKIEESQRQLAMAKEKQRSFVEKFKFIHERALEVESSYVALQDLIDIDKPEQSIIEIENPESGEDITENEESCSLSL